MQPCRQQRWQHAITCDHFVMMFCPQANTHFNYTWAYENWVIWCEGSSSILCFSNILTRQNAEGRSWKIQLHIQFTYLHYCLESIKSSVYFKCLRTAEVHVYCMLERVRHRDRVNIALPSVRPVQMLSQKKRISAKLREEGEMMRGRGGKPVSD